ncbi:MULTISPECIES: outer membrane protein assembly factor BamD [unclassified Helicobacter]|uniref:outer membrane protein assembly factor BamD n=1 Tax=unclassified Helicobacter TaxID=2593540 RepID=UPI000ABABA67|nr:outer membrane protein assembly factor BamD [Helicobacter sp. 'CLO3_human']
MQNGLQMQTQINACQISRIQSNIADKNKKVAKARFCARVAFVVGICALALFISACDKKENNEFNKPAMYWYQSILKEIKFGNLEGADNFYASLQSEHINSPLLPEAMLILGQAHMKKEEYILAEFYFDEYLKRFATARNADYVAYLKLQSRFYGIKNSSKDQEFFSVSLMEFDTFLERFPNSRYVPFVQTMQVRFVLGQNELNKGIVNVYKKQRKQEAMEKYQDRIDSDLESATKPKPSHLPWYVRMFNW